MFYGRSSGSKSQDVLHDDYSCSHFSETESEARNYEPSDSSDANDQEASIKAMKITL